MRQSLARKYLAGLRDLTQPLDAATLASLQVQKTAPASEAVTAYQAKRARPPSVMPQGASVAQTGLAQRTKPASVPWRALPAAQEQSVLEEGVVQRQKHRHTSGLLACFVLCNAWKWFVVCRCMAVLLETSLGDLVIDLYCDNAPKGVPCMCVHMWVG